MNAQISLSATAVSKTRLGTVTASVGGCPAGRGLCHLRLTSPAPRLPCGRTVRPWRRGQRSRLEPVKIQECPVWYLHLFEAAVPVAAVQRRAASPGAAGTAGLPDTCPSPSRSVPRDWAGLAAPQCRLRPAGAASRPGAQHVWGRGAGHPGSWRRWDMPGGCPLPQGNRAAPEHWEALLQSRWWSMA